ncbi:metal-dependent transcriptional regulator [Curtanaerobium respiraculi]|uniref:metal-dependent transcriptional regulator n=1 Tax=Curtanaerobium respiraculi TaxID=2949669 RepID=UPI0024B36E0D|nr:metal-dependent transcriptional regulator [Curtanaerobium respiraculi]
MPLVLHESAEMYLETIHVLSKEKEHVRGVDIAQRMGYSKPTISEWMGKLGDAGYVHIDEKGNISLTEMGNDVATRTYERHEALTEFFTKIGVQPERAESDACRVEHYISDETFDALKRHLTRIEA